MKILELLEVEKSPKSVIANKHDSAKTTAHIGGKPIRNQIIRQLQSMLTSEGDEISKFINADEISLAGCIVQVARQSENYEPDVPPLLSSTPIWSPIPHPKEIGREEAIYRRADHRLPA